MIFPNVHDERWSECTSRVHAGASVLELDWNETLVEYEKRNLNSQDTYRCQMTGCDGKTNSQWSRSLEVAATIIANAMDDKHQNECDQCCGNRIKTLVRELNTRWRQ